MLYIAFGFLDRKVLVVLDEEAMDQYVEQGGGDTPHPSLPQRTGKNGEKTRAQPVRK